MSPAWNNIRWLASVMAAGVAFAPFATATILIIRADNGWLSDLAGIFAILLGQDIARAVQNKLGRKWETLT